MRKFVLFIGLALLVSVLITLPFAGGAAFLFLFLGSANPLFVVCLWALGFAVSAFGFSLLTGDYSWVDRLWSTLPVAFVWYYAGRGGFSPALWTAAVLVTVWGCRLSFNFARKGGYSGIEDYRWNVLRGRIKNPVLWQAFNLLFISFFQIALFVLFTFPVYCIAAVGANGIPALFWVAAVLGLAFIVFETSADEQQWRFHGAKKSAAVGKDFPAQYLGDVKNGFLSHGLFSVSRHPNYFGELGFWWSVWLMALSLSVDILRAGIFGPLALTMLFAGSTVFTESLSSARYPEYRNYQARVSPIIPWFHGKTNSRERSLRETGKVI